MGNVTTVMKELNLEVLTSCGRTE